MKFMILLDFYARVPSPESGPASPTVLRHFHVCLSTWRMFYRYLETRRNISEGNRDEGGES